MSQVTRFSSRDSGPAARVAGFLAHLRAHGLRLGVAETETALRALLVIDACDAEQTRLALKAVCACCSEDAERFDQLFDSYWRNGGRVRQKVVATAPKTAPKHTRTSREQSGSTVDGRGHIDSPDSSKERGETYSDGDGKLVASQVQNLMKKDLRELVSPQDIAAAELVARRLGLAFRDHRSRRRKAASKGDQIDFRRVVRKSLTTGGEPLSLPRRRRPERPVRLVTLCDVSGSMTVYARVFLSFLAGLLRADTTSDAWLFHTRLVRISDALRDPDPLRALNRLTLLADGFGGGSKIGAALDQFSKSAAKKYVNGRTLVIILSDGYDTDPPALMASALQRIKKRGCKVIWLNPLKGWKDYAPVAAGMAAALPFLDLFAAANTLADLSALETKVARL
jgi:uncharacterized protein